MNKNRYTLTIKESKWGQFKWERVIYLGRIELFDPLLFIDSLDETTKSVFLDYTKTNDIEEINRILDFYTEGLKQKRPNYGMTKYFIKLTILNDSISFCKYPSITNLSEKILLDLLDKTQYFSDSKSKFKANSQGLRCIEKPYLNGFMDNFSVEEVLEILDKYTENIKKIVTVSPKVLRKYISPIYFYQPYISLYITKRKGTKLK